VTDQPPAATGQERFCHNCGAPNPDEYNFCFRCGTRVNFLRPIPVPDTFLTGPYPVRYNVQYPEKLSRLLIFVKWLFVIPHFLIVNALSTVSGVVGFIAWFAILFTRRYPKGLFELVVGFNRWGANVAAYAGLLRDEYPPFSTDPGRYPVGYEVEYPEGLSRWLIFVKLLLVIPHYIVLYTLAVIAVFIWIIGWFAILFTGRFPRGLFNFIVGLIRWNYRVSAYASLMRDEFPPYSFSAEAKPGSGRTIALSAVGGLIIVPVVIGSIVAVSTIEPETREVAVRYADARAGYQTIPVEVDGNYVTLLSVEDPADVRRPVQPRAGHRFVRFEIEVWNYNSLFTSVSRENLELKDTQGRHSTPETVGDFSPTGGIVVSGDTVVVQVVFEVRDSADPATLTYAPGFAAYFPIGERVRFEFR